MAGERAGIRIGACQTEWRRDRKSRTARAVRRKETTMYTPPLLGRAAALHQQELRGEAARGRRARQIVVGTRTRGGFFHLAIRVRRAERERAQPARPRPAVV